MKKIRLISAPAFLALIFLASNMLLLVTNNPGVPFIFSFVAMMIFLVFAEYKRTREIKKRSSKDK